MAFSSWDWHEDAECYGLPLSMFFGDGREHPDQRQAREKAAKAVCGRCVVRTECLDVALARNERGGIWGGLDEEERAVERRRRVRGGMLPPRKPKARWSAASGGEWRERDGRGRTKRTAPCPVCGRRVVRQRADGTLTPHVPSGEPKSSTARCTGVAEAVAADA